MPQYAEPGKSNSNSTGTSNAKTDSRSEGQRRSLREMDYESGAVQLRTPPGFSARKKAKELHDAMSGWGTDERAIFDALWTGRPDLNRAIEQEYQRAYGESLKDSLKKELGGKDEARALRLLQHGELSLKDRVNEAMDGWGTDEDAIFINLERASEAELLELKEDSKAQSRLRAELNDTDWKLVQAYLNGKGYLAATLRRAIKGWGTDEAAMWRALEGSSQSEREFVLSQPRLMKDIKKDLSASDWLRCKRMLRGALTSADRVEISMAGRGTDEEGLKAALGELSAADLHNLPPNIDQLLEAELSGRDEMECKELLHQKRLAHDPRYAKKHLEKQSDALGSKALEHPGRSVLLASEGSGLSAIASIKLACKGWGTRDSDLWGVLAALNEDEGRFILQYNPEDILGVMEKDISGTDYKRALSALRGGGAGSVAVVQQALAELGADTRLLYDAVIRILEQGQASVILGDRPLMQGIRRDIARGKYDAVVEALRTGVFSGRLRLAYATEGHGTDEELLFEICKDYREEFLSEGAIDPDVDAILDRELATREYWKALDLVRGPAESEEGKLARAKEIRDRERGGLSTAIMDRLSSKGVHADDAWREYQATYNQAHSDDVVTEKEQTKLREDEAHSLRMTAEYQKAKATVAQWASQIAVAIVGIAATILTAGAAGPFIAGLAASMGGTIGVAAQAMVAAAVLKVGLKKAIEGEGYELTSAEALIDGIGGAIEAGLYVVGNVASIRMMAGLGKTKVAQAVAPAMRARFGDAGTRILAFGLEGTIDGTIGGVGEGLFHALADEETWQQEMGGFFSNVSASVALHGALGAGAGGAGSMFFRSVGQTYTKVFAKNADSTARSASSSLGPADDILSRSSGDLAKNADDQARLFGAVKETHGKMQRVANEVAEELGIPQSKMSIKGQKAGAELNQDNFIAGVMEKSERYRYKEVGTMTDMTRGRFDLDTGADVERVSRKLKEKLDEVVGPENVSFKAPSGDYKRYHLMARDPDTGVWHEFQVGTKATSEFFEGMKVRLPDGVKLHAAPDFHVVMYDTLGNIHKRKIRQKLGLPKGFADQIGLRDLEARYNSMLGETGGPSFDPGKKGAFSSAEFRVRMKELSDEIALVAQRVEDYEPGLLQRLNTKLDNKVAGPKVHGKSTSLDNDFDVPEMPAGPSKIVTKDTPIRKVQDEPQPELRPTHSDMTYEDFPKAKAFLNDSQGKSVVDPETVKQGKLGDCYFIAGCAAVARANPDAISKLIKDNADGTFDVTLHIRKDPFGDPVPVTKTIDAQLPTDTSSRPLYANVGRSTDEGDEIWMALLEKRLAQEKGSYDLISGGKISKGMNFRGVNELLTGRREVRIDTGRDPDSLLKMMDEALNTKKPLTADTVNMEDLPDIRSEAMTHNVFGNHAYAVRSVDLKNRTVNLQNPWGQSHVSDLKIEDFKRFYRAIRVGS